jgi:hypothetical protein
VKNNSSTLTPSSIEPGACFVRVITVAIISDTDARAPTPTSLHASTFSMGETTCQPSDFMAFIVREVTGCSHITVFIEGQITAGFVKSHARTIESRKLSAIPELIFAKISADAGQITYIVAQLL